jgi:AraC-like DNA-binding protein
MPHRIHRPSAPVSEHVDCFWSCWCDPPSAPRERALPSGTLDLVVNLGDEPLSIYASDGAGAPALRGDAIVCGAHAGTYVFGTTPRDHVMGVHFKPGGAFAFLGVPAGELENRHVALEDLWRGTAEDLRERLAEAATMETRFAVMERFLRARLRPTTPNRALEIALRAFDEPSLTSVAEVCVRTGRSPKQLVALFREHVGLSPKSYWRVRRFQAALRTIERRGVASGARIAAEVGYFDQPHFTREFRFFTGMTPREYAAFEGVRPNHVPLRG